MSFNEHEVALKTSTISEPEPEQPTDGNIICSYPLVSLVCCLHRYYFKFVDYVSDIRYAYIEEYGYEVLFTLIILCILWRKLLQRLYMGLFVAYTRYKKASLDKTYAAKYHKNPNVKAEFDSARLKSVEKNIETYEENVVKFVDKQKEKEETKKHEIVSEYLEQNGGGYRLGGIRDRSRSRLLRTEQ